MDGLFAANIQKSDLEILIAYDSASTDQRKQTGEEVIRVLQGIIKELGLAGFGLKLVDGLATSFFVYDKETLEQRCEIDAEEKHLTERYMRKLEKRFPESAYYTLKYAPSAALLPSKIEVSYLVPLLELIETAIHENFHLFFKHLPSHALYSSHLFPEAKIVEERAVEYATFRILGELENRLDNKLLKKEIRDYIEIYGETTKLEQDSYDELINTVDMEEPEREKKREQIATRFYKEIDANYPGLYRNFLKQVREDDANSTVAYLLNRAPYVADHGLLAAIGEAWAASATMQEYAERIGKDLLLEMARQQHKSVFLMKSLTFLNNIRDGDRQVFE